MRRCAPASRLCGVGRRSRGTEGAAGAPSCCRYPPTHRRAPPHCHPPTHHSLPAAPRPGGARQGHHRLRCVLRRGSAGGAPPIGEGAPAGASRAPWAGQGTLAQERPLRGESAGRTRWLLPSPRHSIPLSPLPPLPTPQTPDVHARISKRHFDSRVKDWRKALHAWDQPETAAAAAEAAVAAATSKRTGGECREAAGEGGGRPCAGRRPCSPSAHANVPPLTRMPPVPLPSCPHPRPRPAGRSPGAKSTASGGFRAPPSARGARRVALMSSVVAGALGSGAAAAGDATDDQ